MLEEIILPTTITVHLGRPTASAQNVTIGFVDYIKNVASSEIYPTWPYEALRANIWCQMSLALNRIEAEGIPLISPIPQPLIRHLFPVVISMIISLRLWMRLWEII